MQSNSVITNGLSETDQNFCYNCGSLRAFFGSQRLANLGSISSTIALVFFHANKMRGIYWQIAISKWHIYLTNCDQIWQMVTKFGKWLPNLAIFSTFVWQNPSVSELMKLNGKFYTSAVQLFVRQR